MIKEFRNSTEANIKFSFELSKRKKFGGREFSLNDCRVATTPEDFNALELEFNSGKKLLSMSGDYEAVDSLADRIIDGINNLFDENNDSELTESECESIRKVIHEYFDSLRQQANFL